MSNDGHNQLDPSRDASSDPARQLDDLIGHDPVAPSGEGISVAAVPMARPVDWPGDATGPALPSLVQIGMTPALAYTAVPRPWYPQMSVLRAIIELVVLVPVLFVGIVGGYFGGMLFESEDSRWAGLASSVGMGVTSLGAVAVMLRVAGQRGESVGWSSRRLGADILIGVGTLLAFYVVVIMVSLAVFVISPRLLDGRDTAQQAIEQHLPPMSMTYVMVLMMVTVLWEEVVFRGFLLTRLRAIFKTWWLAVPIGSILFGVAHSYEGGLAMVVIGFLALVMSLLFVWRRSLVPGLVLHWLHNVGAILLLKAVSTTWQ